MAEEPDAWVNSVVRALRGLFRNGETPPRVAIVVAVEHDPNAATLLPERVVSTDGERSTGSWDEVPELIEVVLPREPLPCTGEPCLDLVEHQQHVSLVTQLTNLPQVLTICDIYPTFSLDDFQQHRSARRIDHRF